MEIEKKTSARPPESGAGGENKNINTYAGDMARVLDDDKEGGLIKKIIHQQEEYEDQKKDLSQQSQKNRIFLFFGVLFLFLSVAAVIFLVIFKNNLNKVNVQVPFTPLIFTDESVYKDVSLFTKEKIAQTVVNEKNATLLKYGEVEGIYLTEDKKIIGFQEFIKLIVGSLKIDNAGFVGDNFLLGVVNRGTQDTEAIQYSKHLFILLKIRSFSDIFPSLRLWENKMFFDLHDFFGIDTTADTSYLLTKDYEDGIMDNKNARVLKDNDGNVVFMYVFADDQSIIITDTPSTVHEVMLRLKASQIEK